ncbi:UDP-glycosyltransferase 91C1-like [Iris pallida]|uniref:UDP-glycosyltransferase 91C1-like n=1 Tax=Iris pallida TaxID=29817 RepID=A0AAX6GBU5_IRIPA|nr:UDP-glycosyltransferase 91C1-like [Iris pallida]
MPGWGPTGESLESPCGRRVHDALRVELGDGGPTARTGPDPPTDDYRSGTDRSTSRGQRGQQGGARNDEDGTFDGIGISETLRLVMVEEGGEGYRARSRELKSVIGNKEVQDSYVTKFVEHLKSNRPA